MKREMKYNINEKRCERNRSVLLKIRFIYFSVHRIESTQKGETVARILQK